MSARELADLTPTADDVAWARQLSRSDEHLLALVLSLRCFGRLGYFPRGECRPRSSITSAAAWSPGLRQEITAATNKAEAFKLPIALRPCNGHERVVLAHGIASA